MNNITSDELMRHVEDLQLAAEQGRGDFPEMSAKDSLFVLFREIREETEWLPSIKIGNLEREEVGLPKKPVRTYLSTARYAESEGHVLVSKYLRGHSIDVSASSLSRKAKLLEMPFTVKRESRTLGTPRETTKKGWLGQETTVKENVE